MGTRHRSHRSFRRLARQRPHPRHLKGYPNHGNKHHCELWQEPRSLLLPHRRRHLPPWRLRGNNKWFPPRPHPSSAHPHPPFPLVPPSVNLLLLLLPPLPLLHPRLLLSTLPARWCPRRLHVATPRSGTPLTHSPWMKHQPLPPCLSCCLWWWARHRTSDNLAWKLKNTSTENTLAQGCVRVSGSPFYCIRLPWLWCSPGG